MEIRKLTKVSQSGKYRLVFLGDMHIGSANCDKDRIKRDVKRVCDDPDCSAIVMGDVVEAINPSDPRFDYNAIDPVFTRTQVGRITQEQVKLAIEILQPLRDTESLDGVLYGNHEDVVLRRYHYDAIDQLCEGLVATRATNLEYGALMQYKMVRATTGHNTTHGNGIWKPTVYATHGTGSSGNKESALRKCKQLRLAMDADVYAIGHHHKRIADTESVIVPQWAGRGRVSSRRIGFVCTGAYMRTYLDGIAGYGERRNYPPVEIGSVCVEFDLDTRDFVTYNF